jgi:hypothetical protein
MWQFHWVASLIPDYILNWVYWAIITLCVICIDSGWLGKLIPAYGKYIGLLKPVGVAILVLGVWLRGGYDVEMAWRDKAAKLEEQIKIAESRSKEQNVKIINKIVTKREYYKTRGEDIVKYVDKEIVKYDNTCPIPKEVVTAHNKAAKAEEDKK